MSNQTPARTGGEILADALSLHGVDMAFAVCGESFLPLLDALHDRPQLRLIGCRHEAGAPEPTLCRASRAFWRNWAGRGRKFAASWHSANAH